MKHIRAFVGHSFTEGDAELVSKFEKFLNQLSASHPYFSWQHAEPAEPKVLADKVLDLLADKNVFIGICTKKERVIAPGAMKRVLFPRNWWKAKDEDFSWKTSDWIIQEIGLARGRNLSLILLVETGIRQPGELQGNLNYIQFDREAPEKCFGKIVEMIGALTPKDFGAQSVEASASLPTSEEGGQGEPKIDHKWTAPQPDWKRTDYEFALWHFITFDNTEEATKVSEAYLSTESASQPGNKESWEAYGEYIRLRFGKGGRLAKLKQLAGDNAQNSDILSYLAKAYQEYQQHEEAAKVFEQAAQHANEGSKRLRLLGKAAIAYQKAQRGEDASRTLDHMKSLAQPDHGSEFQILAAQKALAELTGDDDLLLGALERLVDIDPSDNNTRFALAYKHSQLGNEELALFHYSTTPFQERQEGIWNNLGVTFDELDLPAKSVDAYRRAEEMGNTLAMSNLANKLTKAGFLKEAQSICDAALAIKDYHKNVALSVARLKEVTEKEDKKESEFLEKARPLSEFYKEFGRACAMPEPTEFSKTWKGPDCMLTVSFAGAKVTAVGQYETTSFGLRGWAAIAGLGRASESTQSEPSRYRVEYRGVARGRAFIATVTRRPEGTPPKVTSLLGSSQDETKVLMALTDDGRELRVMEMVKDGTPKRYLMQCLASAEKSA